MLSPSAASSRFCSCRAEIAVALLALACFANSLVNGFCYDSVAIVQDNPMVNEPGHWLDLWTVDHWYQGEGRIENRDLLYRPVALLTYRLIRFVTGTEDAWPQHLANVFLHAAVSILVVVFARAVGGSGKMALRSGLFFAVLPIHSEVVNDLVGRSDLLVVLGTVASLLAHRKSLEESVAWARITWRLLALLAVFCALGAKENGVSVLLLLPLFDLFWARRPGTGAKKPCRMPLAMVGRLSYVILPAGVYLVLRFYALGGQLYQTPAVSKTINVLADAPWWQHGLGILQLWGMYWWKTFFPLTLCVDYSIHTVRLATGVLHVDVVIGLVVTAVLIAGSIVFWRRGSRLIAFLSAATILAFLPTSNAVVLIQVFFAERIWYLPSLGVAMLVGTVLAGMPRRPVWSAVFLAVLLAMCTRCWIRNAEWKSNGTVAASAYRDHPDSILTLAMYGHWLAIHGLQEKGIKLLTRAVEIDPGFTVAQRALGEAYMAAGDYERSLQHWQIAEMQFPGHPRSQAALAFLRQKLYSASKTDLYAFRQRADDHPDDVDAELAYVRKLRELARYDEALDRFARTQARFQKSAAWHRQYAETLLYAGRLDDAIGRYRTCVDLIPTDSDPLVELAALLMQRQRGGDLAEARERIRQAMRLAPTRPNVRVLRAELLVLQGHITEALTIYQDVISKLPAGNEHRKTWEARAKALGP